MSFRHLEYTGSARATELLVAWDEALPRFARVIPHDYGRVLEEERSTKMGGLTEIDAAMAAFESNARDLARAAGT